jgi:hypothetical protein
MIKANELRVNNWYLFNGEPGMLCINESFTLYVYFARQSNEMFEKYSFEQRTPIPLSPEVLTACGFEKKYLDRKKVDEGCYYEKEVCSKYYGENYYCDLTFITGDKNGFLEVCLLPVEESVRVRYLHELQNLFYCLAGEELNYTP